jgi:hypothetical protein
MNKTQLISLVITPVVTGSISVAASLAIIVMIYRSRLKLSTIYRRLVFGISSFDLIQSISQMFSSFLMPKGTMWGAVGNHPVCSFQGFMTVVGFAGAALYTFSLTLYFLLRLRFKMTDMSIKQKVEPLLHLIPILYAWGVGIFIYAMDQYNPAGPICWIAPSPPGCKSNADVDCIETLVDIETMQWIAAGCPIFFVFFANCLILVVIWNHTRNYTTPSSTNTSTLSQMRQRSSVLMSSIIKRGRDNDNGHSRNKYSGDHIENSTSEPTKVDESKISPSLRHLFDGKKVETNQVENHEAMEHEGCQTPINSPRPVLSEIDPNGPLAARLSRPSKASQRRQNEISNRAYAYIAGFMITNLFTGIYRIWDQQSGNVPFVIIYLSRLLYPLQGLFNVLIYTYPHVTSFRSRTGSSYLVAFFKVLRAGGDNDIERNSKSDRRDSARKMDLLTIQYQRNSTHNSRIP